jgi:hypothetical protein
VRTSGVVVAASHASARGVCASSVCTSGVSTGGAGSVGGVLVLVEDVLDLSLDLVYGARHDEVWCRVIGLGIDLRRVVLGWKCRSVCSSGGDLTAGQRGYICSR